MQKEERFVDSRGVKNERFSEFVGPPYFGGRSALSKFPALAAKIAQKVSKIVQKLPKIVSNRLNLSKIVPEIFRGPETFRDPEIQRSRDPEVQRYSEIQSYPETQRHSEVHMSNSAD